MRVVCRHRIPVRPHCPCVWSTEAGFLPEHIPAHVQYGAGQMILVHLTYSCRQYTSKRITTNRHFFLPSWRNWFFPLSLHHRLDNSTSWKDWGNSGFLLHLWQNCSYQGKFSSFLQNSWHTLCRDVPVRSVEFLKGACISDSIPVIACSIPKLLFFCDLHYFMPLHVSRGPHMAAIKHTVKLRKKKS